mmetsp:Transcript_14806/g.55800  ORF Transcript_14806/g.55800 Transcript_14806/m.55800 type:complete len:217 (+) Transcript_14806:521-1171(+)
MTGAATPPSNRSHASSARLTSRHGSPTTKEARQSHHSPLHRSCQYRAKSSARWWITACFTSKWLMRTMSMRAVAAAITIAPTASDENSAKHASISWLGLGTLNWASTSTTSSSPPTRAARLATAASARDCFSTDSRMSSTRRQMRSILRYARSCWRSLSRRRASEVWNTSSMLAVAEAQTGAWSARGPGHGSCFSHSDAPPSRNRPSHEPEVARAC